METTREFSEDFFFDEPSCPTCHSSMFWETCDQCGGDGYHDLYEEDPFYYGKDDTEECLNCDSGGGWWICLGKHDGQRCWTQRELDNANS